MLIEIAVAVMVCVVGLVYVSIKPPPPKICGSPGGPPVTSPRFRLRDGRYMAYELRGVPLEKAKHKVVLCHGFRDGKDMILPYSQELLEELGVCFVIYDRPGYGESDPTPKRGPKSDAQDVEELANHLQLGSRFHIMGLSMGSYVAWGCLIYMPHRLAGATLVGISLNYYWSGFPPELMNKCFERQSLQNQWITRIAYYAPWLFYWFMTQKLFPFTTNVNENSFTKEDVEVFQKVHQSPNIAPLLVKAQQQGIYYSLYQDILASNSKWEHSPLDLENPFPDNEGIVHLWQGADDRIIPVEMTRLIAEKLPWIKYHEIPGKGHMFFHYPDLCEGIVRESLS